MGTSNYTGVFKLVQRVDDRLHSLTYPDTGRYSLEYKEGEFVRPVIGGIFIFTDFYYAERYMDWNKQFYPHGIELWRATAENVQQQLRCVIPYVESMLESFWLDNDKAYISGTPTGTFVCESLRLDRLIKRCVYESK